MTRTSEASRPSKALAKAFERCAREERAALIPYVPTGWPTEEGFLDIVDGLCEGGADLLELGLPFGDPVADGPILSRASHQVLQRGLSYGGLTELIHKAHTRTGLPLVAMGYCNTFVQARSRGALPLLHAAGVSTVVIPDLPLESASLLRTPLLEAHLHLALMVTPTTSPERCARLAGASQGFVYLVPRLGITGAGTFKPEDVRLQRARIRTASSLPVCVGFGVRTPEQARQVAQEADGCVVGSALVEALACSSPADWGSVARFFAAGLKEALQKTPLAGGQPKRAEPLP